MFVNLELFRLPKKLCAPENDQYVRRELTKFYSPEQVLIVGRLVHEPTRTFTHGLMTRHGDEMLDEFPARYAKALRDSDNPLGPYLGYQARRWYGVRIVDFQDSNLKKANGLPGWSERLCRPFLEQARRDRRFSQYLNALFYSCAYKGDMPPRVAEVWIREQLGMGQDF